MLKVYYACEKDDPCENKGEIKNKFYFGSFQV